MHRLSVWDTISLVVGGVIGSAIFLVPSALLRPNPAPLAAMLVLFMAGVLSWFGAVAYAELSTRYPGSGGEYVYLTRTWGPLWGFLCGWTHLVVIQTGGIAALAFGFGELLNAIVPLSLAGRKGAALAILLVLTAISCSGLRAGARTNTVLALLKVLGLAIMVVAVSTKGQGRVVDWSMPQPWSLADVGAALVPALWAFEGWNMVTFVAGDVKNPRRSLPLALAGGLGLVIVVYLISLWVILVALPVGEIINSSAAAADAAQKVLGTAGGRLVTLTMLVALAGCLNACILAAPHLYRAQALDGLQFSALGRLHPRLGTPTNALLVQMAWAGVLVWTGSYELLFSYCTFGAWIFYALVVAGLFIARRSPAPAPFRMPGYPLTAIAFLLVATGFVLFTLFDRPGPSLIGLGLVASGIPAYFVWKRWNSPRPVLDSSTAS